MHKKKKPVQTFPPVTLILMEASLGFCGYFKSFSTHVRDRDFTSQQPNTLSPNCQTIFLQRCLPCAWFDPQIISYLILKLSEFHMYQVFRVRKSDTYKTENFSYYQSRLCPWEIMKGPQVFDCLDGYMDRGSKDDDNRWSCSTRVVPGVVWDSCAAELRIEARMATAEGSLLDELYNSTGVIAMSTATKVLLTTARTRRPSKIVVLLYRRLIFSDGIRTNRL